MDPLEKTLTARAGATSRRSLHLFHPLVEEAAPRRPIGWLAKAHEEMG